MYEVLETSDTNDSRALSDQPLDEESLLAEKQPAEEYGFQYGPHWSRFEGFYHRLQAFVHGGQERFRSTAFHLRDSLISWPSFVTHCSLIAIYTAIFWIILQSQPNLPWQTSSSEFYTPARAAMVPEIQQISVQINETLNPYSAPPSPEVDAAWADLFTYANVRLTREEVKQLGRPTIQLVDGSGDYFGSLDVYHQLHCLKYIRRYVHQDYYTLKDTNVPNAVHVDHCIEMLRQVIMCKADTAIETYSWLPDFPAPWPNFDIGHECVNWNRVNNWAKSRAFDVFNPKYLQHPTFGFPYAHLEDLPPPRDP